MSRTADGIDKMLEQHGIAVSRKPKVPKSVSACHFNPHQYNYIWSTSSHKGWGQKRCPKCGLWTVHIHHATGLTASQCEGTETFWAQWRAILDLHKQRSSDV